MKLQTNLCPSRLLLPCGTSSCAQTTRPSRSLLQSSRRSLPLTLPRTACRKHNLCSLPAHGRSLIKHPAYTSLLTQILSYTNLTSVPLLPLSQPRNALHLQSLVCPRMLPQRLLILQKKTSLNRSSHSCPHPLRVIHPPSLHTLPPPLQSSLLHKNLKVIPLRTLP
jgi:hypothetical protein